MHIDKVVKGEKFRYRVFFIPNTMKASVSYLASHEPVECNISEDFKFVILPDCFTQYISGIGRVKVKKLKLNRAQQYEAMDYNGKDPYRNK